MMWTSAMIGWRMMFRSTVPMRRTMVRSHFMIVPLGESQCGIFFKIVKSLSAVLLVQKCYNNDLSFNSMFYDYALEVE
jgi:hypothetical protein